jgi:hypothetical protein
MKALVVAAVGLVALALPATSAAKEIASVTVCGASGCRTTHNPPQQIASGADGVPDPAPAPAPYYTVTLTAGEPGAMESWQIFYVPEPAFLGLRGEAGRAVFERLEEGALPLLQAAARGVEPFPAPTITRVTVGGKRVADPASYTRLLTIEGEESSIAAPADFVPIVFHATRPSPWTELRYLMFSPSSGTLERSISLVELPDRLAAAVAGGASLDGSDGTSGGSVWDDRPVVAAVLVAALVLLGVAWLAARRPRSAHALPD